MLNRVERSTAVLGTLLVVAVLVAWWVGPANPWLLLLIAAAFLVGRVPGLLWRPFFRGRKALDEGRYLEGRRHLIEFQEALEAKPWLIYGMWLSWSAYTRSLQAMLDNNLGVSYLFLGELDPAEAAFEQALATDSEYPIALFNLAVLQYAKGNSERAEVLRTRAAAQGYTGGTRDRLILAAQQVLAAAEGSL